MADRNTLQNLLSINIWCILLLIVSHLPSSAPEIVTATLSSDSRSTIHLTDFVFTHTGCVSIFLSNVSTSTESGNKVNTSRLAFYLFNSYHKHPSKTCILDFPGLYKKAFVPIATFNDLSPPPQSSLQKTLHVPNFTEYEIYFKNCEEKTNVSMNVKIEAFNLDDNGNKDYLPFGQAQLPALFFLLSVFYLGFLLVWIYICCKNKRTRTIHWVMALLLLIKSLSFWFGAEDKHFIKVTGLPHGWDTFYYTFHFIRAIMFSTLIIVIGTGWPFPKPLTKKGKRIVVAIIGIAIQVVFEIAYIFSYEVLPYITYLGCWSFGFLVLDILSCVGLVSPFVMSLKALKESAQEDEDAVMILQKMRFLVKLGICLGLYEYQTRFSQLFLFSQDCGGDVFDHAMTEGMGILFYIVLFYMLQPAGENDPEYKLLDEAMDQETAMAAIHGREFGDI